MYSLHCSGGIFIPAIPSCDEGDLKFADQHGLPWTSVIDATDDRIINSGEVRQSDSVIISG